MFKVILFSFAVLFINLSSYGQIKTNKTEANKQLVLNFWDTFYNKKDTQKAFQVFSENAIYESFALGSVDSGRAKIQQSEEMFVKAFPDGTFESEGIYVDGDFVILRWYADGTNTESLMGMPPTNKFVKVRGCQIFLINDDKIIHVWDYWNMADFMKQLGM